MKLIKIFKKYILCVQKAVCIFNGRYKRKHNEIFKSHINKWTINEHRLQKYTTLTVTNQRDLNASTNLKLNIIQIVNFQIVFDVIRYSLSILCYYQRRVTVPAHNVGHFPNHVS